MMVAACLKFGRTPETKEDANRILREIIVELLGEKKDKHAIAKAIGYSVGSINHLYHVLGIPGHVVRGLEGEATCPCGCGVTWDRRSPGALTRIYAGPGCKYRYVVKQIEAGELTPSSYEICPVCQDKFPVYRELEAVRRSGRKTCPKAGCDKEFRRQRIVEKRPEQMGIFGKIKGKTATHEQRRGYCWQVLEWMGPEVPCVRYQETCGAGCYTGGCYEPAELKTKADGRSAIDPTRAVAMPGRETRR